MKSTMATELLLYALMMAVWRRRPKTPVIHSDQVSQGGSDEFNFCGGLPECKLTGNSDLRS
jgi:putative transposase